ncbi:MAG: B12-binding domain-containing radical SAM protein [Phycisphaera sp.]|nr:B12-binding domain-containing radical SAM protein [Phycisphaera sp.]
MPIQAPDAEAAPAISLSLSNPTPVHPLGTSAKVLLTSVFGPYAQDDEWGSRSLNPMELYHNQVTRVQGPFSLRMFHRSWGLMMIQQNITAPCTVLDFPQQDRFIEELTTRRYDIIGITSIIPNLGKVKRMCELIREHQPGATIVVGGHIANMPTLNEQIDADHVVRGEGVRWFRGYLGEDVDRPIRHPRVLSGLGARTMGVPLSNKPGEIAATLIPSVGCPMGCNFCSTSHMFGGKGKHIDFYPTGDELFAVMCDLEEHLKVWSFFVMDENFLLHRKRALRLLELMKEHHKSWALYVFSSANVLKSYTTEQLIGLGISWVWMGIEGKDSQYAKLSGADTLSLVKELQSHGIRVLGSTIIGLEEHTADNLDAAIEHAISHDTEFHQFMLYTPIPGTLLWKQIENEGRLTDPGCTQPADTHGQLRFNYTHRNLSPGQETDFLIKAFTRDFEVNGPSVIRVARTTLAGYIRYRNHPDARIRRRYELEAKSLATVHAGAVWAARKWFAHDESIRARLDTLRNDLNKTFGLKARLAAPLIGRYVLSKLRKEKARLENGWTYEPPTFYEHARTGQTHVNPSHRTRSTPAQWAVSGARAALAMLGVLVNSR